MINICVPVLRRYDLLERLALSLQQSRVKPDALYVINNGLNELALAPALRAAPCFTYVHTPAHQLGVAESWNWFIDNVAAERIIANDDITFAPESIAKLLAPDAELIWADGVGFSCFVIRDSCVQKIGKFDEEISPGYGYYEDEDYLQRLDGRGTRTPSAKAVNVACGVNHYHSATLQAASHAEILEHHRKFKLAQSNYIKKWHLEETFK